MMVTVFIIITILLGLGIIHIIYSIKTASVDEEQLEQSFDVEAFAKPEGWKMGKMPAGLKNTEKTEKQELKFSREPKSSEGDYTRIHGEIFSKTNESN